jgi:hypothetical protein
MTNNKQQTAVDWLIENHFGGIENCTPDFRHKIDKAKEMEIAGKEMSYADGYKEGYKRAIENAKYQINKWIDKELKITQQ